VDNYQYHCWAEDFTRSPNLEAWLSEPTAHLTKQQIHNTHSKATDRIGVDTNINNGQTSFYNNEELKIGDELYEKIVQIHPDIAHLIVEMFLDTFQDTEIIAMFQNNTELNNNVAEAFEMIQTKYGVINVARDCDDDDW
jgi:hypothetical protein